MHQDRAATLQSQRAHRQPPQRPPQDRDPPPPSSPEATTTALERLPLLRLKCPFKLWSGIAHQVGVAPFIQNHGMMSRLLIVHLRSLLHYRPQKHICGIIFFMASSGYNCTTRLPLPPISSMFRSI
ncbi:hypothetical protein VPH35_117815 [Triticum aestivum]